MLQHVEIDQTAPQTGMYPADAVTINSNATGDPCSPTKHTATTT